MKSFIGLRFLLVFLMFFASTCILTAQEWDALGAKSDAEADAGMDVNRCCWFGAGLVILGVGVAAIKEPSPDPARCMGKSPEYVRAYTNAYKSKAKNIQLMSAAAGCASAVAIAGCVMISISASDASKDACDFGCSPTCTLGDEESCGGCGTSESGGCGSDGCNSGGGK